MGSSVPELSTWAMMALGFAGLGYAAFRRGAKARALAAESSDGERWRPPTGGLFLC
jgi:hypothetical protein